MDDVHGRTSSPPVAVGRLTSLNVGLPRDVEWRGRTVHTGVWKYAVEGPRMVRELNVDGDGQGDLAGHGGPHRAVLVYQLASYDHWRRELNRPELEPGQFGENFTVDGLADDEVCIGDRYQIGAALFEVSQPRVTCYRVGLRLGEPRLPALLVAHGRPGFYLRVLREGHVQAGQPVLRVRTGSERLTVAGVDALLYRPGHDRDEIARARRIPALSPGWQQSFQAMLDSDAATGNAGLNVASAAPAPAWAGFRQLRVADVVAETETVRSVYLEAVDGERLPAPVAGQFLTVRLPDADGEAVSRSYSLSGAPAATTYRLSVKREPTGVGSGLVHALQRGTVLDVAAPRGTFSLSPGDGPVLLISAGVGVTPVLAMLHELAAARSTREVWWLHGARSSADHAFAAESRALLAALPRARSHVAFSAPMPQDKLGHDYTHHGRLSSELLASLALPVDGDAYVCGPASFMADVRAALIGAGLDAARVHTELFGAQPALAPGIAATSARVPHQPTGPAGRGPAVTFARSRLSTAWREDVSSVLELAEACDVPSRWSCRTGVCHNCEVALVSGSVTYDPDPVDPPADGNVLICCAVPTDDVVVDL